MASDAVAKNSLRLGKTRPVPRWNLPANYEVLKDLTIRTLLPFSPTVWLEGSTNGEFIDTPAYHLPIFTSWLEQRDPNHVSQPDHSRMWIFGPIDTDKTGFVSAAVQEVCHRQSRDDMKTQLLYFFCNRYLKTRNNAAAIIKGWLYQLLIQREDLCGEMMFWFGEAENRIFNLDDVFLLWNLFRHALVDGGAGTTYCIISDLHECDEESVQTITKLLSKPFPAEHCLGNHVGMKVLVTSCDAPSSDEFARFDLDTLVWTPLGSAFRTKNPSSPEKVLRDIKSNIREQCCFSLKTLAAIQSPPIVEELLTLLGLEEHQEVFHETIGHCRDLIEVVNNRIHFLSTTTREYFSNAKDTSFIHKTLAQDCLITIGDVLSQTSIANLRKLDRPLDYDVGSLEYAVLHWADHVELASDHAARLLPDIMTTFHGDPDMTQKWAIASLKLLHNVTYVDVLGKYGESAFSPTTVLHALARFNLHQLLHEVRHSDYWSKIVPQLRHFDCFNMDPLAVALSRHHLESAKFFLQEHAPISATHVRFAAGASPELSSMIFRDFLERCPSTLLEVEDVEMVVIKTVPAGDEACFARAIAFLKENNPRCFPLDWIEPLRRVFSHGHSNLVNMLLDITKLDKQETLADIVAHAADTHEEDILTDLLNLPRFKPLLHTDELVNSLTLSIRLRCFRSVNKLLNAKNIDLADQWGCTPLLCGVEYGNAQAIYRLLLCGCELIGTSREAGVALNLLIHEAGINVGMPVLEELLDRGARIQYKDFGITALHVAADRGHTEIMQMVLESLSDAEIKEDLDRQPASAHGDWQDKTALAIAAMKGYAGIVRLLLERGADESIKDKEGKMALDLAKEKSWEEVVEVFEDMNREREEKSEKKKTKKQERNKRKKK